MTQDHSEQLLISCWQQLLKEWPAPVFYVPGNHDDPAMMAQRALHQQFARAHLLLREKFGAASWQIAAPDHQRRDACR
ncbi:MAG: hypothetical protein U5L01_07620 [Rheinheimera sp.]|nr:hypothetical protein [Rheinheimera sp.]